MKTLPNMITAVALATALSGFAFAADNDQQTRDPQSNEPPTSETQTQLPVYDPAAGGATISPSYQDYLVELKNCEPLSGAEREACIDAARRKHGQM